MLTEQELEIVRLLEGAIHMARAYGLDHGTPGATDDAAGDFMHAISAARNIILARAGWRLVHG